MCGRERSYRIGQSGAAGWSKATKPRRHNLIMIAQELLFVNKLFKLPDLLGIRGSLRMGDSGGVWPGGQKGGIVGCPWDKKRRALARLARWAEAQPLHGTHYKGIVCPPAGRFIPQADGLDP